MNRISKHYSTPTHPLSTTALQTMKSTYPLFENQLVSYKEASRYLGISEPYLRRLKSQGKISFVQIGSRGVRFKVSSLNSRDNEREIT